MLLELSSCRGSRRCKGSVPRHGMCLQGNAQIVDGCSILAMRRALGTHARACGGGSRVARLAPQTGRKGRGRCRRQRQRTPCGVAHVGQAEPVYALPSTPSQVPTKRRECASPRLYGTTRLDQIPVRHALQIFRPIAWTPRCCRMPWTAQVNLVNRQATTDILEG